MGVILPIQLPKEIHEVQPLQICVDFGPICGRDPRKGAPTLILDLSQRMGMLVDRSAVAREGCYMGPLKINVAMQIWSARWKICVWI